MTAPPALAQAQDCLSDAQIEQAVGGQIRAGAFTVDTRQLPNKPLCSGLTLAQQIQRIRAEAFPAPPPVATERTPVPPAPTARDMVQTLHQDPDEGPVNRSIAAAPAPRTHRPPAAAPKVKSAAPAPTRVRSTAYYRSCREARAAGAAPIRRGQPGYGKHLDRDGDGIACE